VDKTRTILGFDGLREACRTAPRDSAASFLDALTAILARHTGNREQQDDLTLLALKLRPAAPT
jgi:serine phosphatase RsbU (regulator of sigma subunit)